MRDVGLIYTAQEFKCERRSVKSESSQLQISVCVCVFRIAGGNIQARRRSGIYRFIKLFGLHFTCQ